MFQFLVALAILLYFYGWHKATPARVIPPTKKRKRSRSKSRRSRRNVEEDCLFDDDDDLFKDDDWRSDLAYSGMAGNYYNHD